MYNKLLRLRSLSGFVCAAACFLACISADASEEIPLITDAEEYAVFAAVLFPIEPEAPDRMKNPLEKKAYLDSHRVRLDGVHAGSYRISHLTIAASCSGKEADEEISADYNHKNARQGRIDLEKLRGRAPKGAGISLVGPEKSTATVRNGFGSGVTYLSRPGFDRSRTKAMLQINHVADPEMGAGYLVYLEKSAGSGTWSITDAMLNRRY